MVRLVKMTPYFFEHCGDDSELLSKQGLMCSCFA